MPFICLLLSVMMMFVMFAKEKGKSTVSNKEINKINTDRETWEKSVCYSPDEIIDVRDYYSVRSNMMAAEERALKVIREFPGLERASFGSYYGKKGDQWHQREIIQYIDSALNGKLYGSLHPHWDVPHLQSAINTTISREAMVAWGRWIETTIRERGVSGAELFFECCKNENGKRVIGAGKMVWKPYTTKPDKVYIRVSSMEANDCVRGYPSLELQYKERNKRLIDKYPFLLPRNRWTGKVVEDYDYSYTEMDSMPEGWRKAFGDQMLDELREQLIKDNYLDEFRIMQIKEKYGFLHFYPGPATREIFDIISKYEKLSQTICIHCGKPAKYITTWWISPYCEDCIERVRGHENYVTVEEYFAEVQDDEDETEGAD